MTRTTNARLAGFAYLLYIGVAFPSLLLSDRATGGAGTAAKLASIAQHPSDLRISIVLTLLSGFCALMLAVTLYGITRDEDNELAVLAMSFRIGEGVFSGLHIIATLGLLWLATAGTGPAAPDAAASYALGGVLLKVPGWTATIGATFFAAGSTLFCWLLLRGRMVPVVLARLGVLASLLLLVSLPVQLAGFAGGRYFALMWIPMAVFEVTVALWLLIKGVR